MMNLRLFDFKTDGKRVLELENMAASEPQSLSDFEYWVNKPHPEHTTRRVVMEDDKNFIAGYAYAVHPSWAPVGHFWLWVNVHPDFRGIGIGSALYEDVEQFALANGARELQVEVKEGDSHSIRFSEKRGFYAYRHLFESTLDLESFDETPFQGLISSLEAAGIRFFSLAEAGNTQEALRKLYSVNYATALDIPGSNGTWIPFEEFEAMVRRAEWFNPEGQLLAASGEEYIGLAAVQWIPEKQGAYNLMTGVIPPYRGRKIALALKLLAIRYARQKGARYIRTNNDSHNAPILAINNKLGYQPLPGKYTMKKSVGSDQ
jgi:GNAT superfamily N-acetyltransferase